MRLKSKGNILSKKYLTCQLSRYNANIKDYINNSDVSFWNLYSRFFRKRDNEKFKIVFNACNCHKRRSCESIMVTRV